jgi:hypothetical protein
MPQLKQKSVTHASVPVKVVLAAPVVEVIADPDMTAQVPEDNWTEPGRYRTELSDRPAIAGQDDGLACFSPAEQATER